MIQQLLAEAGQNASAGLVSVNASGVEAASDMKDVQSPETYLGYVRAENFVSSGGAMPDARHLYELQAPRLNEWGVTGDWTIGGESAVLNEKGGSIAYRFHARDLHLVLGPGPGGAPIRFRVTIDGKAPGEGHGADTDAEGLGASPSSGSINSSDRPARSEITPSGSNFSIRACKRSHSHSAENGV